MAETFTTEELENLTKDKAPPKKRGRPKGSKNKSSEEKTKQVQEESKKIQEGLTELLAMPGLAMMAKGDEFCARHFEVQGPRFAAELTKMSEQFPLLRGLLIQGKEGLGIAGFAAAIVAFVYPVAAHHEAAPIIPMLGMAVGADIPTQTFGEEGADVIPFPQNKEPEPKNTETPSTPAS